MEANEDAPPRIQAVTVGRGSRSTGVTCTLVIIGTWRAHATAPGLEDALRSTPPPATPGLQLPARFLVEGI